MKKKLLLKHLFLLFALIVGSTSAWGQETVYSWNGNGSTTTANETGGTATAKGGNANIVVGAKEKGNWCLKFGKGFSNTNYIEIALNNALNGGETVTVGSFITSTSTTASATLGIDFGSTNTQTLYSNHTVLASNGIPDDWTFTVPDAAKNSTTIRVYRNAGSTTVFVSKLVITAGNTTYTVTYNGNGATSGTVPVDENEYEADEEVTVLDNTGNLAKEHFSFDGWNTKADGTGEDRAVGSTFTISEITTLYAKWNPNTNNITLPVADTYGSYTMSATNPVAYGTEVTLTYTPADGYEDYQATWSVNGEVIIGNKFTMPDEAVTVTVEVEEAKDYAELPFEWAGGTKEQLLSLNGVTAYGLGSDYSSGNAPYLVKFDSDDDYIQVKTDSQPGKVIVGVKMLGGATTSKITVQGSSDGETFTNVEVLTISGSQNTVLALETSNAFDANDRYVRLLFTKGSNVGVGPITIAKPSTDPSITANDVEIANDATSGAISYTINNPATNGVLTAAITEGNWLTLGTVGESVPFTCEANTVATERTATVTLTYTYDTNKTVTKDVTITQDAYVAPFEEATYTLATSITPGKHYIIVGKSSDNVYAMGGQNNNNRAAVSVTENNNTITSEEGVVEFVITIPGDDGFYAIYDEAVPGYLYAASNSSNQLKTQTDLTDNGKWKITFDDGVASIVAQGTNTRNVMQYNAGSNLFACYASDSQSPVYLYEKVEGEATVPATITSYKWATFSSDKDLDFGPVSGSVKAYIVTGAEGKTIHTEQVYTAKAGTGLLLYSETAGDYNIPIATEEVEEEYSDNKLIAVTEDNFEVGVPTSGTNYVLTVQEGKVVFAYIGTTPAYLNKGQAYLNLAGAPAAPYLGFDGDDTTGINNVERGALNVEGCYTLDGRRVENPTKGVYIVNGKKVVIK